MMMIPLSREEKGRRRRDVEYLALRPPRTLGIVVGGVEGGSPYKLLLTLLRVVVVMTTQVSTQVSLYPLTSSSHEEEEAVTAVTLVHEDDAVAMAGPALEDVRPLRSSH